MGQPVTGNRGMPSWWWVAVVVAVAVRPQLWWVALGTLWRLAPEGWWRRWPPLPRPGSAYLQFRMRTAYGEDLSTWCADDVVTFLYWRRDFCRLK